MVFRTACRCHRQVMKRWSRQSFLLKAIIVLMALFAIWLTYLSYSINRSGSLRDIDVPPHLPIRCQLASELLHYSCVGTVHDHTSNASLKLDNRVLLLVETPFTSVGQDIRSMLEANKIRFKQEIAGKNLPNLTQRDKGKYGVVIFERLQSYLTMDRWNQEMLEKYCRQYGVGIIAFASPEEQLNRAQVKNFPLFITSKLHLSRYELNAMSPVLRITRAGQTVMTSVPTDDWTAFEFNHTTYEPIAYAMSDNNSSAQKHVVVFLDQGTYDGIRRIVFGNKLRFWLHRTLFMDALSYLSYGKFSTDLERYILVDIDDVFVAKSGHRMKAADVKVIDLFTS